MKKTGIRTYEVKSGDFPIDVRIRAVGLDECQIVVSEVQIVRDGALLGRAPVDVSEDQASLSVSYEIKKPSQRAPCDLLQAVNGFFGKSAPDSAKYETTLTSALGDSFKTSIGVPSIDPGIANLTFQFR
jgi:hypothetical protein